MSYWTKRRRINANVAQQLADLSNVDDHPELIVDSIGSLEFSSESFLLPAGMSGSNSQVTHVTLNTSCSDGYLDEVTEEDFEF
jgi:hypothetical protein